MEPSKLRRPAAPILIVAAALALWAAAAPARAHHRAPRLPLRVCDHEWWEGTWHVKQLIKCAAHRWDVPGGARKALAVAACESGFRPDAYNPAGYAGVFQQAVRYWPTRATHYGFPGRSPFNARANVIVSIRMAAAVGWGPWGCA
ncbi:MAG TPA: hypothetical protein VNP94_04780 [Actinomycetota bacterium]|nr:hypothetical protein [Actinomycetota bacterium]